MPSLAELAREARVQREHLCKGHVAWLNGTSRGCGRCGCRRRCPGGGGEHDLEALIIDVLQSGYRVGLPGLRIDVDVACFLEPRRELRIRIYHILKRHLLGIRGHAVRRRLRPRLLRRRGLLRLLRLLRGFLLWLIRLRRGLLHLRVPRRSGRSRIMLLRSIRAGLEVRLHGVRREQGRGRRPRLARAGQVFAQPAFEILLGGGELVIRFLQVAPALRLVVKIALQPLHVLLLRREALLETRHHLLRGLAVALNLLQATKLLGEACLVGIQLGAACLRLGQARAQIIRFPDSLCRRLDFLG
mmetsp:Transcript_44310/g.126862  ORF Transcript_44310/g.126862 Transcript_44310/m.126862 type:complete len:301 (-) Transcript_44310:417-1319(-)